jgi:dTDP-glucose pyrophosphorylase
MSCTLLIPAAGESSRFRAQYGGVPKGLIRFGWRTGEKTMIEHCVPRGWEGNVVVMCREQDADLFAAELPSTWFLQSVPHTTGQADTVQQAWVPADHEVLVVNCDNGFENGMGMFLTACRRFKASAGAVVMPGRGNRRYGYVDDYPLFRRAVEKSAISNYALAGAFYFQNIETIKDAYALLIAEGAGAGERYLSALFERITGPKVAYHISKNELHEWGTPELLHADHSVTQLSEQPLCQRRK